MQLKFLHASLLREQKEEKGMLGFFQLIYSIIYRADKWFVACNAWRYKNTFKLHCKADLIIQLEPFCSYIQKWQTVLYEKITI